MTRRVAALFVDPVRGPYGRIPGVEAWGRDRDAWEYDGVDPVVAHPACAPWGRFRWRYRRGSPDGLPEDSFFAVDRVRCNGGVLEHPAHSSFWKAAKLPAPRPGRRSRTDRHGCFAREVRQVDWGHPAEKRTWLYVCGVDPASIPPDPPRRQPTAVIGERTRHSRGPRNPLPEVPKSRRHVTPAAFAAYLAGIASGARGRECRGDPRIRAMRAWRAWARKEKL